MPHYDYTASDGDGRPSKGSRDAADPKQLAALLSADGYFLVSCRAVETPAEHPAGRPPERLLTDDDKLSPLERRIGRIRAFLMTPKGMALLGGLAVCGALGDYAYMSRMPNNPFRTVEAPPMSDEDRFIAGIEPGMRRGDIERRFTTKAEGSTPERTLYALTPTTRVLIVYDATGGAGSADNHVLRRPQRQNILAR